MKSEDRYVVDTHALIWYMLNDGRLSPTARGILRDAEAGHHLALISVVVLSEVLWVVEKKRSWLTMGELYERISAFPSFQVIPFDSQVFCQMLQLPAGMELHDRALVATAQLYQAKLFTRDAELRRLGVVATVW